MSIHLLLADVDGTLLTSAKVLAPSTIGAARRLKERGVALAITSSRPPRGLLPFIEALGISVPTGAFNGGAFVKPDLTVLAQSVLPPEVAAGVVATIRAQGLDAWTYTADEWYVQDPEGAHVARERMAVRFAPKVVHSYDPVMDRAVKIVGVTDDPALMAEAERAVSETFAGAVSASRSQTYYLDVTHPDANKGNVVTWL
jgi:HAD superfamily hydrolase (TIGR01484 family)